MKRKAVECHLQTATRIHLDLAYVKLHHTEVTLKETQAKVNETQETIKNLKKEFETFQKQFKEEVSNDKKDEVKEKIVMTKRETCDFPLMFVWKIDNFSKSKAGKKKMVSAPFYTECYGYKLRVDMYPDGYGLNNEYLSVCIHVMKGEYDAILPWPFNRIVKFTLIDQQEDPDKRENVTHKVIPDNNPSCYARPKKEENPSGHGDATFISHKKLNSRRYIVDDTLFLQVEVGPTLK